ncbi:hexokinase [Seiridium cupressi]
MLPSRETESPAPGLLLFLSSLRGHRALPLSRPPDWKEQQRAIPPPRVETSLLFSIGTSRLDDWSNLHDRDGPSQRHRRLWTQSSYASNTCWTRSLALQSVRFSSAAAGACQFAKLLSQYFRGAAWRNYAQSRASVAEEDTAAADPMSSAGLEEKARQGDKVVAQGSLNFVPIVSLAFLTLVLIAQVFLTDAKFQYSRLLTSHPFTRITSSSPAAVLYEPVCKSPHPFPTAPPVSKARTMALIEETRRITAQFEYTDNDVNKGVQEFLRQMNEGLEKDHTSLSQIPTYVTGVPNGTEKGLYLAVDLGGTNFRVCSIHLNGDTTFNLTYSKVAIPKELMVAKTSQELFAFLAKQIELFLKTHHEDHFEAHIRRRQTISSAEGYKDEHIFRLGFTFSFPVQQLGINKGNLIRWTKGFDIPDAIGKDVCALLQDEIDKLHLPVKVAALVNDTVGTLMARSYTSPGKTSTLLGAIFGTGTNGAYVEKTRNIKKDVEGEFDKSTGDMVINTEWGSFDNQLNVLPNTPWDIELDKNSVNPGIQMFEKRVSGMFLGEIVRLVIVDMLKNEKISLFRDENSSFNDWKSTTTIGGQSGILTQWGLDSSIMSIAAADNTPEHSTLRQELEKQLQIYAASLEDAQAFKNVAYAVGRRAARLSAVAIGAIVLQSGQLQDGSEDPIDIGVDGSLVEHYPYFRDMIYEALGVIKGIGPDGAKRIRIGIAKDGSGVGAALIALVAAGMENKGVAGAVSHVFNDVKDKVANALPDTGSSTTMV